VGTGVGVDVGVTVGIGVGVGGQTISMSGWKEHANMTVVVARMATRGSTLLAFMVFSSCVSRGSFYRIKVPSCLLLFIAASAKDKSSRGRSITKTYNLLNWDNVQDAASFDRNIIFQGRGRRVDFQRA